MRKRLIILGSTGSIGRKVLEVVEDFPGCFEVTAIAANSQFDLVARQARQFRPKAIGVASAQFEAPLRDLASETGAKPFCGEAGLADIVDRFDADLVVVATVGFVGLVPTVRAIERGMTVALANKEVLVTAGDIVMRLAQERNVHILPIDSEHNAIFQCLRAGQAGTVRRLVLTASGGPFRGANRDQMHAITPEEALCHPTWNMGPKITIDSATLMNKGFEVIEATHLFNIPVDKIDVVIHPQSTIHSMVEYIDGSIIAQLGVTDMYLPIQNVLFYPERVHNKYPPLDFASLARLTFEKPDVANFPCLAYACEAVRRGHTYPTVLNAANEVAVARFLAGEIPFLRIPEIIRAALDAHAPGARLSLEDIHQADGWAREYTRQRQ